VPERGPIASAVVGPCSPERGTKGGKATP
jgi:hypothetical protein